MAPQPRRARRARRRPRLRSGVPGRRPTFRDYQEGLLLGKRFGINVTEDDALFLGFTALQALISPDTARDRVRMVPAILERSVPNTEVTRARLGRLLAGIARLTEAGSVLLTVPDYDLLAHIRDAARDSLDPLSRKPRPLEEEDLAAAAFVFWHGAMRIIRDLKVHPDPKVRSAIATLGRAGDLLDVDRELAPPHRRKS